MTDGGGRRSSAGHSFSRPSRGGSAMGELTGKACLVTGGSRGIGRAIALELGRHGASVAVGYANNKEAAEEVAAEIATSGGEAFAFGCDVQDPDGDRAGGRQRPRALREDRRARQQRRDHARPLAGQDVAGGMGRRAPDEPEQRLPPDFASAAAHGRGRLRPDRQHQLGDRRSTATSARPTTPRRRPGSSASRSPRRSSSPARASRSTRSRPASSRPR